MRCLENTKGGASAQALANESVKMVHFMKDTVSITLLASLRHYVPPMVWPVVDAALEERMSAQGLAVSGGGGAQSSAGICTATQVLGSHSNRAMTGPPTTGRVRPM